MYSPYPRRRSPLRPERSRRSVLVWIALGLTALIVLCAGVHNVRFFYRRSVLTDEVSLDQPALATASKVRPFKVGIEIENSEALLDGGEGSQEEHTALAVSNDRTLIGAGEDLTLFGDAGAEDKLLGGVETSEYKAPRKRGASRKESEDDDTVLEEEDLLVHPGNEAVFVVEDESALDEEARRGGKKDKGSDSETDEDVVGGSEIQPHKVGSVEKGAKSLGKRPKGGGKKPVTKKSGHSSCDPKFASSAKALAEPSADVARFESFDLRYFGAGDELAGNGAGRFNGQQSQDQREESFHIQDPMTIHCGFMGSGGGPTPGFNLDPKDSDDLASCHIAVVSATFGASDIIHSISKSQVSDLSHRTVCFVLFVDDASLAVLKRDKKPGIGKDGRIGIWRPVIVRPPLPYEDPRRTGKIPKLLTHRLFPRARYSIWIDAKLKLVQDPRTVLERFLWREGAEFTISNHYDRHDVKEEVLQNKKLNKYDHGAIDEQYATYVREGLEPFNASDPNRPLLSYIPEGSFIVREHTPMSNLFSCLWFNEVDRFTSRDQLSFAHTYLRLTRANPDRQFRLHMFLDCERRATAKLFRHRADAGSTQKERTAV